MRWKWILSGIAGLIVLVIIVAVVVLYTYDYNKLKPQIANAVKQRTGRELSLGGDLKLDLDFTPALVMNNVSFSNVSWGSRPHMANIERFEIEVALWPLIGGEVQIKSLKLIKPDILIETKAEQTNLQFKPQISAEKKKPAAEKPQPGEGVSIPQITLEKVVLQDARIVYQELPKKVSHTLDLKRLTLQQKSFDQPFSLDLEGQLNNADYSAQGSFGSLKSLTSSEEPWLIDLQAEIKNTALKLKGQVKNVLAQSGIDLQLSVASDDLAQLGSVLDRPMPVKGPFSLSAAIKDPRTKYYQMSDLSLNLDKNQLKGQAAVDLSSSKPRLEANLSSPKMDLTSVLQPAQTSTESKKGDPQKGQKSKKSPRLFSDKSLNLPALDFLNASLDLTVNELILPQISLTDVHCLLKLQDGRLSIKPLESKLAGGTLKGALTANTLSRKWKIDSQINIDSISPGELLPRLRSLLLEGKLNAMVDVSTTGDTVSEFMTGLNGRVGSSLTQAKLKNKLLDKIGGDLRANLMRLINPLAQASDYTTINCFVSMFQVEQGLAKSKIFLMDTKQLKVLGSGQIDLGNERLDFAFDPEPKEGIGIEQLGKFNLSLSQLANNLKLSGTLANPSLAVDPGQAALTLGKALGGTALFGPAGAAATLIGGSGGEEDPCAAALDNLAGKSPESKKQESREATKPQEKIEEGLKGIGESLKKFMGQ